MLLVVGPVASCVDPVTGLPPNLNATSPTPRLTGWQVRVTNLAAEQRSVTVYVLSLIHI